MFENHPAIIHEMVHVRIHKKFGFKEWRIVQGSKSLVCIMTLPGSILYPRYIPKLFLWELMHFVHDTIIPFIWLDIITITENLKHFLLSGRKIIKEILKKE